MEGSSDSQAALVWNAVSMNNCTWMKTPGRYLLRKNNWKDPKYYTSLTGIWDRVCGRIKLYVTDKEGFMTNEQLQQHQKITGDYEHIKRKTLVLNLKQICVMYNNMVDGVTTIRNSHKSEKVLKDCEVVLLKTMEEINSAIIDGYDSFALEKEGDTLQELAATLFSAVLDFQEALLSATSMESSPSTSNPARETKIKAERKQQKRGQ